MAQTERAQRSPYPRPFEPGYLAPRYWATWLGMGALFLVHYLPTAVRLGLGEWLGAQIHRRNTKRRAIVEANLRLCFPEKSGQERERMARGFFCQLAQCQLDYGLLWWGSKRRLDRALQVEGEEHLRPHMEAGRPVILLTGHHTAVDFAGIAINRRYPRALSLFKHLRNPLLDWMVARGRVRSGGLMFERSDNVLPWVRLVRDGYLFYYIPDEDLGPERSVFAPFFGVQAATLTSLAKLSRMCNAVVVPYMAYHREGRYVAKLFPALEGYPSGDEVADAAAMNGALERMVREAPEQYVWSLRLFQTRPAGEASPYGMKPRLSSGKALQRGGNGNACSSTGTAPAPSARSSRRPRSMPSPRA